MVQVALRRPLQQGLRRSIYVFNTVLHAIRLSAKETAHFLVYHSLITHEAESVEISVV
jgi:hypothetical protein